MKAIRSALVVGAGAIGAVVASEIHAVDPEAVALCATGARRQRYLRDGFVVNGKRYDFRLAALSAPAPYDLVLVAVKSYNLTEAIEEVRPYVGSDTIILSLLNGITSEEALRAEFGADKVPLATIIGIDAQRVDNKIDFVNAGKIQFGFEKNDPESPDDRVNTVSSFFSTYGIPYSVPSDMVRALWFKFMVNVSINQWSAVLKGTYGMFQRSASARELLVETMKEVIALSGAFGVGLVPKDMETVFATIDKLDARGKTSMLQDVDAGRRTEVDAFAGVVVEKSREHGLSAPINQSLLLAIRAMEEELGV